MSTVQLKTEVGVWLDLERYNAVMAELGRLHIYETTLWECDAATCKGVNHMSAGDPVRCWRCNRIRANWPRDFQSDASGDVKP